MTNEQHCQVRLWVVPSQFCSLISFFGYSRSEQVATCVTCGFPQMGSFVSLDPRCKCGFRQAYDTESPQQRLVDMNRRRFMMSTKGPLLWMDKIPSHNFEAMPWETILYWYLQENHHSRVWFRGAKWNSFIRSIYPQLLKASKGTTIFPHFLGVPSPFFPGILLSKKPPKTLAKQIRFLKRTMVEKNGIGINP